MGQELLCHSITKLESIVKRSCLDCRMAVSNVECCNLAYEGNLPSLKVKYGDDRVSLTKLDQSKRMALHWACAASRELVIDFLVEECGVPVDIEDDAGWTPLMIASSVGNFPIVMKLLTHNAPVNAVNETGNAALHYAASKDWFQIAELLLERGADVNVQDKSTGSTPLHRAASKGNTQIVKLLLDHQAVVNIADNQGNSPLHLACEEERNKECDLLVAAGASITSNNKEEKTPLDLAPPYLSRRLQAIVQR